MKQKLEELIEEAKKHTFQNNSFGTFSRASVDMQAWIAECEDLVLTNYGKDSVPWRIFESFEKEYLNGFYENEFNKQKSIIVTVLTVCSRISPNGKSNVHIETKDLDLTKVFVVHGHDALLMTEVARFIEKLGLEPIILHEKASSGKTIIEKIEKYSNVGFGIVLYTPCDLGASKDNISNLRPRARQNVIFEHGFLIGKIGRKNVCALVKDTVETPNDISGVVYISVENEWKLNLAKEMKNSGYQINMNLVI